MHNFLFSLSPSFPVRFLFPVYVALSIFSDRISICRILMGKKEGKCRCKYITRFSFSAQRWHTHTDTLSCSQLNAECFLLRIHELVCEADVVNLHLISLIKRIYSYTQSSAQTLIITIIILVIWWRWKWSDSHILFFCQIIIRFWWHIQWNVPLSPCSQRANKIQP